MATKTAIKTGTQIKTWEDICAGLAIDPVQSLAFLDQVDEADKKHMVADFKLKKLSQLNWQQAKKVPDLRDRKQEKWYPVFWGNNPDKPSSFGFSFSGTNFVYSDSAVGLRLSHPDERLSDHAGTQFEDWYRDLHVVAE